MGSTADDVSLPGNLCAGILCEDNHLLAVNKRAGVLTQGDKTGDACVLDACRQYLKEKYAKPGKVFLGLVHRLDRPVSGLLLLARTSKAAARLSEQFRRRTTRKLYLALVAGKPPAPAGELAHWLTGDRRRLRSSVSNEPRPRAKRARLCYDTLGRHGAHTLLVVRLLTGYKHQIRAQLAAAGCPIVGDYKYTPGGRGALRLLGGRAVALHAWRLAFTHPTRRVRLALRAPLPGFWSTELGLREPTAPLSPEFI